MVQEHGEVSPVPQLGPWDTGAPILLLEEVILMMLSRKTPKARREARSYCRRCLAVMLCCVLAFGLTVRTAPRAQAAGIVDGTSAVEIAGGPNLTVIKGGAAGGAEAAVTSASGATFGAFLLAACGIDMLADSVEYSKTRYYGGTPYEKGNELWAYLYDLGGDFADWCMGVDSSDGYAGIRPGDSFTVPAKVAEEARKWALSNLDFAENGQMDLADRVLFIDGQQIILTVKPDTIPVGWYKNLANLSNSGIQFGSLWNFVNSERFSFFGLNEDGTQWKYCMVDLDPASVAGNTQLLPFGEFRYIDNGVMTWSRGFKDTAYAFFWLDDYRGKTYLTPGILDLERGVLFTSDFRGKFLEVSASDITNLTTTFSKTTALDQPKTEDLTITIPPELPTTQVGELTIPVITEITSTDLTEIGGENNPSVDPTPSTGLTPSQITQAVTEAWPATGSPIGDQVIEETMNNPDDLSISVITKFPFSIPWDIAKAIELLAAPPKTPRFEFDFFGPMDDLVGGFPGDTTIVIDFADYEIVGIATRWLSTVFFIYALASGTKRMLWTS